MQPTHPTTRRYETEADPVVSIVDNLAAQRPYPPEGHPLDAPWFKGAAPGHSEEPAPPPTDTEAMLAQRGSRYGSFFEQSMVTQAIKAAMRNSRNWATLADDQRDALEMIAVKAGRMLTGDPDYIDNWDDIEGYARLVSQRMKGNVI